MDTHIPDTAGEDPYRDGAGCSVIGRLIRVFRLIAPERWCAAPAGADLDADDAEGEAGQDRGQGRPARQGRHVPAGGGGGAPGVVRGDPGADRWAARRRAPGDGSSRAGGERLETGGTGMVCREGCEGGWPMDEPKGAVGALGRASGLPTTPNSPFSL